MVESQIEAVMDYREKLKKIRGVLLDVDGVLAESRLLVTEEGLLLRTMQSKDGYALKVAVRAGVHVGIITGGTNPGVRIRLEKLGVQHIYMGAEVKLPYFEELIQQWQIDAEEVLYMGDDIADIPVLQRVGLKTCPADAAADVKAIVDYISPYRGGNGAVRDVLEQLLKLQGKWPYNSD